MIYDERSMNKPPFAINLHTFNVGDKITVGGQFVLEVCAKKKNPDSLGFTVLIKTTRIPRTFLQKVVDLFKK